MSKRTYIVLTSVELPDQIPVSQDCCDRVMSSIGLAARAVLAPDYAGTPEVTVGWERRGRSTRCSISSSTRPSYSIDARAPGRDDAEHKQHPRQRARRFFPTKPSS
jgi:hypothetical protein